MESGEATGRTPWCTGLLDLLSRSNEFKIGIGHHLRVERLLDQVGPAAGPADLKYLLAPILATSVEQQRRFYELFDEYWASLALPRVDEGEESDGGTDETAAKPSAPRHHLPHSRVRTALVVVTAAAMLLLAESGPRISRIPIVQPPPNGAPPVSVSPPPSSVPEEVPEADLLPPVFVPRGPSWYERNAALVRWALAVAPLLWLAGYELRRRYRERAAILRERVPPPPYVWPITPPRLSGRLFSTSEVVAVSTRLRRRQRSGEQRFAVSRSVAATVAAGGYPTFLYEPVTRPPEYLVLVERESARDHQALYYQALLDELSREGAYISVYFYRHDPRVCFPPGSTHGLRVADLAALHPDHRLLIVGAGTGLLDPIRSSLAGWTDVLTTWSERAVLGTVPHARRGSRGRVLRRGFVVLPATLNGFSRISDRVEGVPVADGNRHSLHQDVAPAPAVGPDLPERLRQYLGDDVFRWLCACAVYPELHWDLTLSYAELPELATGSLAQEENLLRLFALPWFRSGHMPNGLRYELLVALEKMDQGEQKETELSVRTALALTLAREPKTESVAGLTLQRELLLQELYIHREEPRKSRRLLKQLRDRTPDVDLLQDATVVRLLRKVRPSRLALVLPDRVREALYRHGLAGFGPSRTLTATMGLAVALLLWMGTPVPQQHTGLQIVPLVERLHLPVGSTFDLSTAVLDTSGSVIEGPPVEWSSPNPNAASVTRGGRLRMIGHTSEVMLRASAGGSQAGTWVEAPSDGPSANLIVVEAAARWALTGLAVRLPWAVPDSSSQTGAAGTCTGDSPRLISDISSSYPVVGTRTARSGSATIWVVKGRYLQVTALYVGTELVGPRRVMEEPLPASNAERVLYSTRRLSGYDITLLERKAALLRADPTLALRAVVIGRNAELGISDALARDLESWFHNAGFSADRVDVISSDERCDLGPDIRAAIPPSLRVEFAARGVVSDTMAVYPIIPQSVRLIEGDSLQLNWRVPQSTSSPVVWTSSSPSVAIVSGSGLIRALNVGVTMIEAAGEGIRSPLVPVTVTARPAIGSYYEGIIGDGENASRFHLSLRPGPNNLYTGTIVWPDEVIEGWGEHSEEVRGRYDPRSDTLQLQGQFVPDDANEISPGLYRIGFSLTRDTIGGLSRRIEGPRTWSPISGRRARARVRPVFSVCRDMQADTTPLTLTSGRGATINVYVRRTLSGAFPTAEEAGAGRTTSSAPAVVKVLADALPVSGGIPRAPVFVVGGAPGDAVLTYQCGASVQRIRVKVTPPPPPPAPVDTVTPVPDSADQRRSIDGSDALLTQNGRCLVDQAAAARRLVLRIPRTINSIYVFLQTHGPIEEAESERLGTAMTQEEFVKCFVPFRELAQRRKMRLIITATDAQHRGWYHPQIMVSGRTLPLVQLKLPGGEETAPGAEVP